MGVFLNALSQAVQWLSLPHARGGVSDFLRHRFLEVRSSPRPWGCFLNFNLSKDGNGVFPTPVGVFL
ncbi:conserved hypothetical protein [methanotrophic bacterial endosymbiont of Bathymodiolus sp.]|nr:conserved hypothetical protein [methanotrophic bacterial endosymbiont of Bathymodiolus sp.]